MGRQGAGAPDFRKVTLSVALRTRIGSFTLEVDLQAPAGLTALFGASGSGKTSIINAIAGLLRPGHGRVVVQGVTLLDTAAGISVPRHRRRIGTVFQDARLFPHLSVRQNLAYGGWFAAGGKPAAAEFDRVVALLNLGALLARRPHGLSGGEAQRVAIGRALLCQPRLLLMDEPLASLDEARKAEILPYLEQLRDESALPILYVSHSLAEVARLATTIIGIDRGRVTQSGPAAQVLAGLSPLAPQALSFLMAEVVEPEPDGLTRLATSSGSLWLPGLAAVPPGTRLRVLVAAQDVILSRSAPLGLSALNILAARVTGLRQDGARVTVQLASGSDLFLASVTGRSARALALAPGVDCHAIMKSLAIAPQPGTRATTS